MILCPALMAEVLHKVNENPLARRPPAAIESRPP
jgi:hypothetical protein